MGAAEEVNDENMATEDSSPDEERMPPDISPDKDDGLHDQGIWGRVETVVGPEAFKAATSAEEKNEKAFENMENAKDNKGLENAEEFKYFCEVIFSGEERRSRMRKLIEQTNGYSTTGLYHSGVRDDPVSAFKVQHMAWRVNVDPHPMTKYTLSENDLFKHMCTMDPLSSAPVTFVAPSMTSSCRRLRMLRNCLGSARSALGESYLTFRERQSSISRRTHECYASLLPRIWC